MACEACNHAKHDLLPSEWLEHVPPLVAAIESRISLSIGKDLRSRRVDANGDRRKSKSPFVDEFREAVMRIVENGDEHGFYTYFERAKTGFDEEDLAREAGEVHALVFSSIHRRTVIDRWVMAAEVRKRRRGRK